jgi:hypothetical protein
MREVWGKRSTPGQSDDDLAAWTMESAPLGRPGNEATV